MSFEMLFVRVCRQKYSRRSPRWTIRSKEFRQCHHGKIWIIWWENEHPINNGCICQLSNATLGAHSIQVLDTWCGDVQSFFCGGCRYRVTAYPDWTAAKVTLSSIALLHSGSMLCPVHAQGQMVVLRKPLPCVDVSFYPPTWLQVKQALWAGGIVRANRPAGKSNTPGMERWEDLVKTCSYTVSTAAQRCTIYMSPTRVLLQQPEHDHHCRTSCCDACVQEAQLGCLLSLPST